MFFQIFIYLNFLIFFINFSLGITTNYPNVPSYSFSPKIPSNPKKGPLFGKVGTISKKGSPRADKNDIKETKGGIHGGKLRAFERLIAAGYKVGKKGSGSIFRDPKKLGGQRNQFRLKDIKGAIGQGKQERLSPAERKLVSRKTKGGKTRRTR